MVGAAALTGLAAPAASVARKGTTTKAPAKAPVKSKSGAVVPAAKRRGSATAKRAVGRRTPARRGSYSLLPKPSSYLRLDYPEAEYLGFKGDCPFEFDVNSKAIVKEDKGCGYSITYPKMKATIYITYKSVNGDINQLLKDAQKLFFFC